MDERNAIGMSATTPNRAFRRQAVAAGLLSSAVLGLLFVYPVAWIVVKGFRWPTVGELVRNRRIWRIIWFSGWQALASTLGVLILATPLAGLLAGRPVAGRRWLLAVIAAPFTLPTVVVAASFREVLPRSLASGVPAIISAHIFYNLGMATLILLPRFELIDQTLAQAASTLGASRSRIHRTITLPLVAPAIINAALLTFTLCFTSFGVVLMLGGSRRTTLDVEIYQQALQRSRFDRASVLAVFQFAVLATLAFLSSRRRPTALSNRPARRPNKVGPGSRSYARNTLVLIVLFFVVAPLTALVRRSLREPSGSFGLENFCALWRITKGSGLINSPISSFGVSARSAAIAGTLALIIGAGLVVAAQEVVRLRSTFRLFASLPLATSSVQLGLGFLLAFAAAPLAWRSRWFAVPLVQAVVSVPFVVRQLSPVLEAVPRGLRNAAMTLGASPWRAWRTIDFRLSRPAFTSAMAIALAISLGEFGAATFLARPDGPTVPVAIARLSGHPGDVVQGQAAALATLLGLVTLVLVIVARTLGAANPSPTSRTLEPSPSPSPNSETSSITSKAPTASKLPVSPSQSAALSRGAQPLRGGQRE